ncbi:helix-turn-helix transcriptional regulator, partial [Streptomyces sp.]|uniref:helix-turn-helix transcriptional regulator n=1 Tax=Streptomyces sp. TaxID=1931 RepID=UPI002F3EA936
DESVARALTDAAGRALNRGGAAEATAALSRAADLSPDAADRTRRRVDAAIAAVVGGQLEECAHLLRVTADDAMPVALAVRRATAAAFVMVYRDSDMEGVYREILPVLERIPPGEEHDSDFEDAYYTLFVACFWLGRPELWERLRRCLDRVSPLGKLCYAAAADPARTAHDVRRRIAPAAATLPLERRFWQVNWLVWTAHYVDGFGDHSALWRGLTERGAYTTHQFMTAARSYDVYLHGGWDEALAVAGEGVERARDLGYDFYARIFDYVAGLVAAGRGDEPERRRCADTLTDWARPRRLRLVLSEVAEIEIRAAMTRGAYDEAYTLASRQTPPGELPPFFPHFHRIFLDLVEAAVRCGHLAEARAHVAAGRAARMGEISAHHALLLATAAALVAPDDEAAAAFDAALALPEADRWPFEHARLQLAYGVWLRRHQDKGAARGQLRCAVETFRRLGAEPWADRAAEELRASGEVLGPRPAALAALLTAQETRIAELAAKGMTNREIGQLMHLSPRTVGAHLYKIFPKLGITSRVALRDSLLGMGAGH